MRIRLRHPLITRSLAILGIVAVVLLAYFLWARPTQLRWGATDAEWRRAMPGDKLDPDPDFLATRAISIDAAPEEIWPWLIQMGYTRAGLYGFDLFEKAGITRGPLGVDRILPQFQDVQVGDEVPITPIETMILDDIKPYEHTVWRTADAASSYTWGLYPDGNGTTRLIVRTRWDYHLSQPGRLVLDVLTEFTDHVAMRKVLQGIKGRVEGAIQPRSDTNVEVFIYLGTLTIFVWTLLAILRLPLSRNSVLVALAGGLAWLIAWYGPWSLWIGATLSLLVVWAMRLQQRERRRRMIIENSKREAR